MSNEKKPGLQVASVFGATRIEVTDGEQTIALDITKKGVEQLIEELHIVLDMADEDE